MDEGKTITLDDLALMVKAGFDGVDKRFNSVDKRFNLIDNRFDLVDDRFDRIENLILVEHKRKIDHLEIEVRKLKEALIVP